MCGIFVAYKSGDISNFDVAKLHEATEAVEHRGPDHTGFFRDQSCFMGHTRLAILDLEPWSNQPFKYDDLTMTYNGEVFNFIELRKELEDLGYVFTTNSDTEVVLIAFKEWGTQCFDKFNGMWALAIYDSATNQLVVSRDRFGQKPLFTAHEDGVWYFASEPHQLTHVVSADPDYAAIKGFLEEGNSLNDGRTFFKNVSEVPCASVITINDIGQPKIEQFWSYPCALSNKTDDEASSEFEHLLVDAVSVRMRSDVPLSVCLSGGVDSTIITDIVCELAEKQENVSTYTYRSIDSFDESSYAKIVADRLGCRLVVVDQSDDPETYILGLKRLVFRMGRGHSSPAIMSNDFIQSKIRRDGFVVSLDGQGADELLAGYKTFYFHLIADQLKRCDFGQLIETIRAMGRQKSQFPHGVLTIAISFLRINMPRWFRKLMRRIYGYQRFFSNYHESINVDLPWLPKDASRRQSILNRQLIGEHSRGLRNLIFYGDIVAMNNSVENRSPFLDHRLVDLVFSSGNKLKVWNGVEKYALRSMKRYQKYADVLDRDKIGFESTIRMKTKQIMLSQLRESAILTWPIFSRNILELIESDELLRPKYERLAFRIFQVHLWHESFSGVRGRGEQ